jgi:hypothetical protein
MLMHTFSKTIILTRFVIQQDQIARSLCENRSAPEKKCCGKCQLKKRMENDQKQSPFSSTEKSLNDLVLMNDGNEKATLFVFSVSSFLYPNFLKTAPSSFKGSLFRPPCIG